jgi:hypothetical protein
MIGLSIGSKEIPPIPWDSDTQIHYSADYADEDMDDIDDIPYGDGYGGTE